MNICAIILSAGKSKRFKSSKPKFLHEISGKALIQFNIDALKKIYQVKNTFNAVSYSHLTLPTIYSVENSVVAVSIKK